MRFDLLTIGGLLMLAILAICFSVWIPFGDARITSTNEDVRIADQPIIHHTIGEILLIERSTWIDDDLGPWTISEAAFTHDTTIFFDRPGKLLRHITTEYRLATITGIREQH